jgi:tetratricopeptide (TPR) repeat protein
MPRLLLCVWLCAVTIPAAAQDVTPERQLANGWVALAAGDAEAALRIGDDLMRQNLRTHRALQLAVAAELALGRLPAALDRYEAWLTPGRPDDVYLLGEIALARLRTLAQSRDPLVEADARALLQQEQLTPAGGLPPVTSAGPALDAALARAGDRDAAQRLAERVAQPLGPEATFVLQAIGDTKATGAAPGVRKLLESPDPAVRGSAAQALGKIGGPEDIPRLKVLAGERFPFVRASAQVALARLGDVEGQQQVAELLRSDAGELRLMAAEALGLTESARWGQAVTELLESESLMIRIQAALLLSRAGLNVPTAQATLAQAMAGDNPILREQASSAFAEGPKADPALLRKMLRDSDDRVVLRGVRGLLVMVR